jgi:hypothetical protein
MAIPIAFEAKQSGSTSLSGFTGTQVLTLNLSSVPPNPNAKNPNPNRYVIWGRVVIHNLDGSPKTPELVCRTSRATFSIGSTFA